MKRPFYTTLYFRVLVGIAVGVAIGLAWPSAGAALKPLGDGFIKLIKMTIAPLIFCSVVTGIAGMKHARDVGKAGGFAILYFEVMSTLALAIGLVIVNLVGPGFGMVAPSADAAADKLIAGAHHPASAVDWLLGIIPDTFVGAFAHGDLLPVLLVALLFGFALHATGERGAPVADLVDRIGHVIYAVIAIIMELAPIGAGGAIAATIGTYGVRSLGALGELMACFYATCVVFVLVVLGIVARLHGFSIVRFIHYIREELFIVLGTSSSESVLPRMMDKLERLGAGRQTVGLVIPAGYSFNLDGTAIYVTMAAVFIAQATGTPLSLGGQLELLGIALLTSKGAAGVTGSGFVTLAATIDVVGTLPAVGLRLITGIDRFMSEARALTNVIGNGVATLVVAKWCRDLDSAKLAAELGQKQHESR
ncbi:MAG TPA: C4-dicarboxylate transporter DctA [Kofleriaceae bacterium]|jgi:aerobic C4-dicarboxylate transport protein